MDRRAFLLTSGVMGAVGLAGCSERTGTERERERLQFRTGERRFERRRNGQFEEFLVQGVNMGMAKPGRFPGEAAITRAEYDRWIAWIGELRANAIRTYTIHPPAFYDALAAYNREADEPIYLFQGTWIGEERLREAGDVTALAPAFHEELRRTVDVVHGETTLEERPGHASGRYETDVSDYLAGYIAGIEWPPTVVMETNDAGSAGRYRGEFVATTAASPFERWLAESLDAVVAHGVDRYGTQRPVAFTNWVTTDPLEHPYEPFHLEDAVSVDPDALVATDAFEAGLFAAYHVYPYYPDFLNHTPAYVDDIDHRGEPNSYAGYLDDLVGATEGPLLIAEFGVPDSRGIAHRHVHGRDQGRHTEREQGEIVAAMYEDIVEADTAGGLVFTWQDEWFKRTWNLEPFSVPSRRPHWSNVQTPEQRFGLFTFDPADRVRLDGSAADWTDATRLSPADGPTGIGDGADGSRTLESVAVTHDAAALSLRLEFASLPEPVDWDETNAIVLLSHTGRGNTTVPFGTDADAPPTDFVVRVAGPDASRVRVDSYYDAFAREYGAEAGLDLSAYRERDSGRFSPIRMTINRGYTVPPTGERVPFEAVETGRLRFGNGNPDASAYDSLADVSVASESDAIELRLPWSLLNVADPSSRLALGDLWAGGTETFEPFDTISVAAATFAPDADGDARPVPGETNLVHAVPGLEDGRLRTGTYTWEPWTTPEYRERRKESYWILRDAFGEYTS